MRMTHPRAFAIATLALALITGCSPAPAPTPSGPAIATPSTTPSTSPSTPSAELYAEAERVFREYVAEEDEIMHNGGVVSEKIYTLMAAPALTDQLNTFRMMRNQNISSKGVQEIRYVKPAPTKHRGESIVALTACLDRSRVKYFVDGEQVGTETKLLATNYFTYDKGTLKFSDQEGSMGEDAC